MLTTLSIYDIVVGLLFNLAGGLDRISKEPSVQLALGKIKPFALWLVVRDFVSACKFVKGGFREASISFSENFE